MCVVTRIMHCTERAHIIPFTINNTTKALKLLLPILQVAQRLMGDGFTSQIRDLTSGISRSDADWNVFTLVSSLHVYGDVKGLIGYRPRCIEEAEDGRYNVTFTIHWLLKNTLNPNESAEPTGAFCYDMTSELPEFTGHKAHVVQFDFEGNQIEDGHLVKIPLPREDAVKMMHMLKLRWEAGIFYCLAGAAGLTFDELEKDNEDDREEYDMQSGVNESEEANEYFGAYGY